MSKNETFLNKWFYLNFSGSIRRAQCIDIEFETNIGQPLFLMETKLGNKFWLTRNEIRTHMVVATGILTKT